MNRIINGGLAGIIATVTMSLVIVAGRRLGLLYTPPPKHITQRVADRLHLSRDLPRPVFQTSWILAHFGYGAVSGVLHALIRDRIPGPRLLGGLLFGGLLWAVSYFGLMPGLRLYPSPEHDSPTRMGTMIAAHAVYGVTLAWAERLLGGRGSARGA